MKLNKMALTLHIVTPAAPAYSGEITQVTLPTEAGEITILSNHQPLVSILREGEMWFRDEDGQVQRYAVAGGFLEITRENEVHVLADSAELVQ